MEVIVTERGLPVARVIPYVREETVDEKIQRMISLGTLRPRKHKGLLPVGKTRPGGLHRFLKARRD